MAFAFTYWAGRIYLNNKLKFNFPGNLRGVKKWVEYSSVHDIVGRMTPLGLPKNALFEPVSIGANPIFDHLRYFRKRSPVPLLISSEILMKDVNLKVLRNNLFLRSIRRKNFINTITFFVFVFYIFIFNSNSLWGTLAASLVIFLGANFIFSSIRWAYEASIQKIQIEEYKKSGNLFGLPDNKSHYLIGVVLLMISIMNLLPFIDIWLTLVGEEQDEGLILWSIVWFTFLISCFISSISLLVGYNTKGFLVLASSILLSLSYMLDIISTNFPTIYFYNYGLYKIGQDFAFCSPILSILVIILLWLTRKYSTKLNPLFDKFVELVP